MWQFLSALYYCITLYVICLSFSEVTVWLVVFFFSNSIGLQYISKILCWNNNNCIILYKNTDTGPAFTASVQRREIREGYYVVMKESFEHCMFFYVYMLSFWFPFFLSCPNMSYAFLMLPLYYYVIQYAPIVCRIIRIIMWKGDITVDKSMITSFPKLTKCPSCPNRLIKAQTGTSGNLLQIKQRQTRL